MKKILPIIKAIEAAEQWAEREFGGHLSIGPVTIFGYNAMHGQIDINTKRFGYVCVKPPTYMFGRWWPAQLYLSPNATPAASTLLLGKDHTKAEKIAAILRWALWGHGYDSEQLNPLEILDLVETAMFRAGHR